MTNLLLYEYYYRYGEHRKQTKILVDAANYEEAKTKLETVIAEHESKYSNAELLARKDFNYGEKLILDHIKLHLDTVIENSDPTFTDINGQIKHQSDIVKDELLREPEQDYSVTAG